MDRIIRNWREIVKPEDVVIHLGDVQVGKGHDLARLMASLPGTKVLVMGNHDTKSTLWYMRNGFAFAADAFAYKGMTLTHHPAESLIDGTKLNIHGHVHNSLWGPKHPFQRLLAIEHVDYRPVDFLKWSGMAGSEEKWKLYQKTWRTPVITGRKNNAQQGL